MVHVRAKSSHLSTRSLQIANNCLVRAIRHAEADELVLLLTTELRPEEARVLRRDHVDLDAGTVAVWCSDRAGGDTKTPKPRRTLRPPDVPP